MVVFPGHFAFIHDLPLAYHVLALFGRWCDDNTKFKVKPRKLHSLYTLVKINNRKLSHFHEFYFIVFFLNIFSTYYNVYLIFLISSINTYLCQRLFFSVKSGKERGENSTSNLIMTKYGPFGY